MVFTVSESFMPTAKLQEEMQQIIKRQLNPLFKIDEVILMDKLPRTATNKVMRQQLRDSLTNCP